MRRITLLLFLIFCARTEVCAQFFPVDTAKLNTACRVMEKTPTDKKSQQTFFDAFPKTWMAFIMTYQYVDSPLYDLAMYRLAGKQIALLARCDLIADTLYFDRLINLSIGGRLDADAPNYLHQVIHKSMCGSGQRAFLSRVAQYNKSYQLLFWQFYWSAVFRKDYSEQFSTLRKVIRGEHPEMLPTFDIAYDYFCGGIVLWDPLQQIPANKSDNVSN